MNLSISYFASWNVFETTEAIRIEEIRKVEIESRSRQLTHPSTIFIVVVAVTYITLHSRSTLQTHASAPRSIVDKFCSELASLALFFSEVTELSIIDRIVGDTLELKEGWKSTCALFIKLKLFLWSFRIWHWLSTWPEVSTCNGHGGRVMIYARGIENTQFCYK